MVGSRRLEDAFQRQDNALAEVRRDSVQLREQRDRSETTFVLQTKHMPCLCAALCWLLETSFGIGMAIVINRSHHSRALSISTRSLATL